MAMAMAVAAMRSEEGGEGIYLGYMGLGSTVKIEGTPWHGTGPLCVISRKERRSLFVP